MGKQLLVLLLIFNSSILFSQDIKKDYVILRPQGNTTRIDTIYGEVILPKNEIITNAKIIVNNEKMKYAPEKVIGFKYGERFFASVPYNSHGNVFAERVEKGIWIYAIMIPIRKDITEDFQEQLRQV